MFSARDRVFSTPELLEAILVQLAPTNHILQAQRISRLFHNTITSSPTIQQLLFFRPSSNRPWTIKPLLGQHFPPWFFMPDFKTLSNLEWASTPGRRDAFLRPDASRRQMLFVQLAPLELKVVRHIDNQGGIICEEGSISFPAGVPMQPLYDLAESYVRNEHVGSSGVSVRDGEDGGASRITLYLMSTKQCCGYRRKKETFMLLNAERENYKYALVRKRSTEREWNTDLTAEVGGVGMEEWEAWTKNEVPVLQGEEEPDENDGWW